MIPLAKPVLDEREVEAVRRVLLSGWVTQGPEVAAFEREFATRVGAAHACAVSSCTAALFMALRALGIGEGDEVVTASHSFVATANSVRACGAIPVFADVEPRSYNLSPEEVERAITPRTRAILCVHQLGMPCDLRRLEEVSRSHGLPLIEDAACAVGSRVHLRERWEAIGRPHGLVACFSFHPRKVLTTGDGGMLTTSDPELDRRFRRLRHQGMSVSDVARHSSSRVVFESYDTLGYNFRMTDIQAAMGRVQLERLDLLIAERRRLAARYLDELAAIPGLELPAEPTWAESNWQSFCVVLPARTDLASVMQRLLDRGISSRRGVMCAHREPVYATEPWSCGGRPCSCPPGSCRRLAVSESRQDRGLILPLFPGMTEGEQAAVVEALRRAMGA